MPEGESPGPGRPSLFTDELAAEICSRLSTGETLVSICTDSHMPAVRTVSDWKKSEAFSAAFARARDEGFDALAEECLAIADDGSADYKLVSNRDGHEDVVVDSEHIQRSKLRIETRLKLLAKWDPKRYGDKLDVNANHSGGFSVTVKQFTPAPDGA